MIWFKNGIAAILLCVTSWAIAQQPNQSPADKLFQIIEADSTFEVSLTAQSEFPSLTLEAFSRRRLFYDSLRNELLGLDTSVLTTQQRIDFEMLLFSLEDRIAQIEFEDYLVPLNAEGGWYTDFLLQIGRVRKTPQDYDRYLRRLEAFPVYARQQMALMKLGLEKGRTAPRDILRGREGVVDRCLVKAPEESPFYEPFLEMPPSIPPQIQDSLRRRARLLIAEGVTPVYEEFARFWKEVYIPGAVSAPGISAQPKGRAWYEQRIRHYTTLDMTPEQVYEIGQREVARIRKEMEDIIQALGFQESFQDFLEFLRTDPQFYCTTPEQLLKEASYIAKRIDGKLPAYFGRLPRNSYGVEPVPALLAPTYTGGRYSPGSLKAGRAGQYWVNTYNLPARPLYVLPSLTLHEAVPGHHLQISLAQEMEGVPRFRRNTYLSAFGEGWALYAEWLGEEMGIYTSAYERFGKLTYEMWRACRLVVDPGIHAMGWSRQQAIDFMVSNTALSVHECTTEVDRYIGWPGQAVSYKIGELKIRELRQRAEERLGPKFNLRDFHDKVLENGSIPLFTLERIVNEWIEQVASQ